MSIFTGFDLGGSGYTRLNRNITKEEETLLANIFHTADENQKGYLTKDDIKVAVVELLGYKPTKYEVSQILDNYGEQIEESEHGLSLEKFILAMSEKLTKRDIDEEIRHTFMAFDMQCHGFLTVEDLKKVFSRVAPHIPAPSVHSAFREMDQDGDGRISYKDFEYVMKYNTTYHI